MTKQIIFGDDVSNVTANGIAFVDQAGALLATPAAVIAAKMFRVERVGSMVKSPWINQKDITSVSVGTGAAAVAESFSVTLIEDAAATEDGTFKLINVASGYEPFGRASFEIAVNGAANTIAVALAAAITANLPSWVASATAPGAGVLTIVGKAYAGGMTAASASQVAWDPNGSVATCSVPTVVTAASKGTGDQYIAMDLEKSLLGSGVSDYDRATFLPDGTTLYASLGFPYELSTITYNNPTVNQINGVDNERVLILAVRNSAAAVAPATAIVDTITAGL